MIIQCDKCLTKFKLDESKITGKGINVRCTKCQNVFAVTPPEAAAPPPPPPPPPTTPPQPLTDNGFDFDVQADAGTGGQDAFGTNDLGGFAPSVPTGQDKEEPSFGGQDFDFGVPPEGGQGAADAGNDWSLGGGGEGDFGNAAFGGADIGGGAPPPQENEEPFAEQPPVQPPPAQQPTEEDWGIESAGEGQAREEVKDEALDRALGKKEEPGAKETVPTAPSQGAAHDVSDTDFAAALSKSIEGESVAKAPAAAAVKKPGAASSKKTGIAAVVVIIILIILGAAAYYLGLGGGAQPEVGKTVEIDSIKGYFAENPSAGKFFVIEAKIKNITASPQPVAGVTGVIYDSKGGKLSSRPAAVISGPDIMNLTRDEIEKVGKPGSLGTIPPKGALPIVVIFTVTPAGMSEYGVEIMPQ